MPHVNFGLLKVRQSCRGSLGAQKATQTGTIQLDCDKLRVSVCTQVEGPPSVAHVDEAVVWGASLKRRHAVEKLNVDERSVSRKRSSSCFARAERRSAV